MANRTQDNPNPKYINNSQIARPPVVKAPPVQQPRPALAPSQEPRPATIQAKFAPNADDIAAIDAEFERRFEKLEYEDERLQWPPSDVEIGVQDGIATGPVIGTCGHWAKSSFHTCGCDCYLV
jgi:hypothetical protein